MTIHPFQKESVHTDLHIHLTMPPVGVLSITIRASTPPEPPPPATPAAPVGMPAPQPVAWWRRWWSALPAINALVRLMQTMGHW